MKLLQSQPKLIEIETRLNKQSYLSRGNLPGSADAKMFLFLQSIKSTFLIIKGYPDRKIYPNFYHWYILMKQFAISSVQKWIINGDYLEEDQLIGDFIARQNEKMMLNDTQLIKKNSNIITETMMMEDSNIKATSTKVSEQTFANSNNINCHELQYIMDVKIKQGTKSNMRELVTNFLYNQQVQSPDIQELLEERRVRIVAKMDPQKYQQLKNKISALEGVQTFQSKKKDKRFMTNNSTNNFLLSQLS